MDWGEWVNKGQKWSQAPGNIEELNEYTKLVKFIEANLWPRRSRVPYQDQQDASTALWNVPPLTNSVNATSHGHQAPRPDHSPVNPGKHKSVLLLQPDLFKAARYEILYVLDKNVDGARIPAKAALNIAALQRTVLQDLQQRIAVYVAAMKNHEEVRVKKEDSFVLADLLNKYTEAVRNLDFVRDCAKRGFNHDPFIMSTSRELEWRNMKRAGLLPPALDQLLSIALDHKDPVLFPAAPYRNYANRKTARSAAIVRFLMAAFGGAALIAPMLIMVLVPSKVTSLVVTSVFTLAFAAVLAIGSNLEPDKILASTAAYAAVLVVFVGTSSST